MTWGSRSLPPHPRGPDPGVAHPADAPAPIGQKVESSRAEVAGAVHALHLSALMLEKAHPSSLTEVEVLDRVLDKGIVIDALCHVSIAGTELVTVRSHVVVASIDTYLKYFEEDAGVADPRPGTKAAPRASRQATRVIEFPAFLPD